jgi:hypothetical protein
MITARDKPATQHQADAHTSRYTQMRKCTQAHRQMHRLQTIWEVQKALRDKKLSATKNHSGNIERDMIEAGKCKKRCNNETTQQEKHVTKETTGKKRTKCEMNDRKARTRQLSRAKEKERAEKKKREIGAQQTEHSIAEQKSTEQKQRRTLTTASPLQRTMMSSKAVASAAASCWNKD